MKNKWLIAACWSVLAIAPFTSCSHPATGKTPSAVNVTLPEARTKPSAAATPRREERLVIAYEGEAGKTALELLKARARVRTTSSQMGELVEEINGVANGNGYYLLYFVNGATAKTGAAQYVTQNGDKIEWKLIGPRKQ